MRLVFQDQKSFDQKAHFCAYDHDERFVQNPHYVNIRKDIQPFMTEWLNDLQASHTNLSLEISKQSPEWWFTPLSRLDARPWGQEPVLKPLFFALGVAQWIKKNPQIEQLILVGCPKAARDLILEKIENRAILNCFFGAFTQSVKFFTKICAEVISIAVNHCFRKPKWISTQFVLSHEVLPNLNIQKSYEYYFGDLLNQTIETNQLGCFAITYPFTKLNQARSDAKSLKNSYLLFDFMDFRDLLYAFWRNVSLYVTVFGIKAKESKYFWTYFVQEQLTKLNCVREILANRILRRILKTSTSEVLIYPYEEKGIERALALAARENKVAVIGYSPHPQHRFLLALRDDATMVVPKPDRYGVAGQANLDYFVEKAGKKKKSIFIWGSSKSKTATFNGLHQTNLKALLVISHPDELQIFESWLHAEPELFRNTSYFVRLYEAVQYEEQRSRLKKISDQFMCVKESSGDFSASLQEIDLILFSATSAGISGIQAGKLAIHVALGGFFQINPCFDRLETVMSCAGSEDLKNRITQIRKLSPNELEMLYQNQKRLAEEIFSAPHPDSIKLSLCFENHSKKQSCLAS